MTRYIFTVTAGRSGQSSLTDFLNRNDPACLAIFEGPQVRPVLPGRFGHYERRFRRRFIETHEMLGRGKVLGAFAHGDDIFLEKIARQRLRRIDHQVRSQRASIYVDVSKYFARGIHRGYLRALPQISVIHLVRDPLKNMRSFLNRDKNFHLDNTLPSAPNNMLQMDSSNFDKGELYLWAWCEMNLRFYALAQNAKVDKVVEIRTEDLANAEKMSGFLKSLGLHHKNLEFAPPMNTNKSLGFSETQVIADDVELFRRFAQKISPDILENISYLRGYDPERAIAA